MAGQSSAMGILGILFWGALGSCLVAYVGGGNHGETSSTTPVRPESTAHAILAAAVPEPATYTVQPGDGWFLIARKVGVDSGDLLAANGATPETVIHPGQVLQLPSQARRPTQFPPPPRHLAPTTPTYAPPSYAPPVYAPPTYRTIPYEGNGGGPTLCADGSVSGSSGRGTCSHHGGISGGGGSHHHAGGGHHRH